MRCYLVIPLVALLSCTSLLGCSKVDTVGQSDPSGSVTVKSAAPKQYRVSVDNLPPPYATSSAQKPPTMIPRPANATLYAPAGFSVNVFSFDVARPRWITLAPNGDVILVESNKNRVKILRDADRDGKADGVFVFAEGEGEGLNQPMGVAVRDGYLYIGNTTGVVRFRYQPGQTKANGPAENFITGITPGGYNQHWTRNIVFSPDNSRLYLSVGSASNVSVENPPRATIQVFGSDGTGQRTFASGLRNPVGMAFNPVTGKLWTTVNERDGLGDDLVPDYLTSVSDGGFYGWPFAYLSPKLEDPRRKGERPDLVAKTLTPEVPFESHSAALGLVFYTGDRFPQQYRNDAFVAFRGSWNRSQGTGYKIVRVPFNPDGTPTAGYEDFVWGWLADPNVPTAWGRPVGLLVASDGSLLVADEMGDTVWRISYSGR